MQRNEYPYRQEIEAAFRSLGESWAAVWNVYGQLSIYLLYRSRFYPLGSPASVASLSLGALSETIALAKRHAELGYQTLPGGVSEAEQISGVPDTQIVVPNWLEKLRSTGERHVPQHTVPLARLRLPLSIVQQMLQLPDDYAVRQIAVEEDTLCIYFLTPECVAMDGSSGNPVMRADYRVEEHGGVSWRSLISIAIEQAGVQ